MQASGLGIEVGRFSRPQRGVGMLAMPDATLDTTRHVESVCHVRLGTCVLELLVPDMAVTVIIDRHCVADEVTVTH
jgi:hypothetical protein